MALNWNGLICNVSSQLYLTASNICPCHHCQVLDETAAARTLRDRFHPDSRGHMERKDLAETRSQPLGFPVVAGYPGARLIGSTWRFVPESS